LAAWIADWARTFVRATPGDRFWFFLTTPQFGDPGVVVGSCREDPDGEDFRERARPLAARGARSTGGVVECEPTGTFSFCVQGRSEALISLLIRWTREHREEHRGVVSLIGSSRPADGPAVRDQWRVLLPDSVSPLGHAGARAAGAALRTLEAGRPRLFALLRADAEGAPRLLIQGPHQQEAEFHRICARLLGRSESPDRWIVGRVRLDAQERLELGVSDETPNITARVREWAEAWQAQLPWALKALQTARIVWYAADGPSRSADLFPAD
jgi:hypothetical protein